MNMLSRKKLFVASTIILVFALAIPFCFPERFQVIYARLQGAETFLYPSTIDLGDFAPGATTSASFRAYNFTSHEIKITGAIVSCGCITHEELPKIIPAHCSVMLTVDVRLPSHNSLLDQSVTYLISESRGMAMRKARILASIPNPLPLPPENEADESNAENSDAEEEANVEEADSVDREAQSADYVVNVRRDRSTEINH